MGCVLISEHVKRRLAAILAADVVASSRLMGVDEEGTLARLKALRKTLFDPVSLGNTVGALGCYLLLIEDETETRKLLSSPPVPMPKASGRINHGGCIADIGEKLGAIGCTLALIEDAAATAKVMARAKKRRLPLRSLKLLAAPRAMSKSEAPQ
jgi:hypothetical protein